MIRLKLRDSRLNKGISQETIADLIGMTQCNYSRRENGKKNITDSEWIKIAKVLDVKIEDIRDTSVIPNSNLQIEENSDIEKKLNLISKYIKSLEKENKQLKKRINSIVNLKEK